MSETMPATITIGVTIMQEAYGLHIYAFSATFDVEEYEGTPKLLERIFDSGNEGEIRKHLLYSLSVGDKVAFDLLANNKAYNMGVYSCAPSGWDFTPPLSDEKVDHSI
jgi:hypothetical protein